MENKKERKSKVVNDKELNQYYGKYFESAIVSTINNDDIMNYYHESFIDFGEEDIKSIISGANKVAKYLDATSAEYIGDHTMTECGDIKINGNTRVEIKRVSSSSSTTYHNTSVSYLTRFGFDYNNFLDKNGYYDFLMNLGINANKNNKSPVGQEESRTIRYGKMKDIWENIIQPEEKRIRKLFVKELAKYFSENNDALLTLINDMTYKVKTGEESKRKGRPDRYIIYDYKKDIISEIDLNNIKLGTMKIADNSFTVGDIRIQIGWQNGNGLNNPSVRMFLKRSKK